MFILVMLQVFFKYLMIYSCLFIFINKGIRLIRSFVYVGGIQYWQVLYLFRCIKLLVYELKQGLYSDFNFINQIVNNLKLGDFM